MRLARLLEWRRRRGLSQQELADKSGVARDAISKYERMRREAQPSTARRLAGALGVEVEDLLYREDLGASPWGKPYGNVLRAARESGGRKAEIALLRRYADEAEPGPGRSIHESQAAEVAFVQALAELDLSAMPGTTAALVRSYVQLVGSFVAAGLRVPAGMARTLVEALEREGKEDRRKS